jgi:hypothetical protein
MSKSRKLGIIQSRGLGDIVIALPIARYYYEQGWEVVWPICDTFMDNVVDYVPWVKWVPIPVDPQGRFFYDVPMERLRNFKCDEILPLYQHLTGHDFSQELYFQYTSFDQYKYLRAGVPFLNKWRLADCITRHPDREQRLREQLVTNPLYALVHLEGSDHKAQFDPSIIPPDWQTIYITEGLTKSIFDWCDLLDHAQSIICVDSCMANLVDQLALGEDRYFIPRSHIGLTPVQGQHWNWVKF